MFSVCALTSPTSPTMPNKKCVHFKTKMHAFRRWKCAHFLPLCRAHIRRGNAGTGTANDGVRSSFARRQSNCGACPHKARLLEVLLEGSIVIVDATNRVFDCAWWHLLLPKRHQPYSKWHLLLPKRPCSGIYFYRTGFLVAFTFTEKPIQA